MLLDAHVETHGGEQGQQGRVVKTYENLRAEQSTKKWSRVAQRKLGRFMTPMPARQPPVRLMLRVGLLLARFRRGAPTPPQNSCANSAARPARHGMRPCGAELYTQHGTYNYRAVDPFWL